MKRFSWTQFLLVLWIFLILGSATQFPGRIDGLIWPVIENFSIEKSQEFDNGIIIWGTFNKVRECNFLDNYGIYKFSDNYTKVSIDFLESAKIRTIGAHSFGPWYLSVDKDKLQNIQFYAVHDCVPLWKTITPLTIKVN